MIYINDNRTPPRRGHFVVVVGHKLTRLCVNSPKVRLSEVR